MAAAHTPPTSPNYYPQVQIDLIQNPIRFYAFPIFGGLVKIIILIPVFIEAFFLSIAVFFLLIVNAFYVLLSGKYYQATYDLALGVMRLGVKISFFMNGLTNSYPGFSLALPDNIKLEIAMPLTPNRMFAIPLFGIIARAILLIPYAIYSAVLSRGAQVGAIISSFFVLFKGRYPQSTYEFERDSIRVGLAASSYVFGFSDTYPNFWISMNHQTIKILLIIAGAMALFSFNQGTNSKPQTQNKFNQTPNYQLDTPNLQNNQKYY